MNNLKKNKQGYGYKYTDLSAIHDYLESTGQRYTQYIKRIEGEDYVMTKKYQGDQLIEELQGCRVVQATLSGKSNPAQEQGSALTYARRYSLLMAYGLATEDDDAASLTKEYLNKTQISTLQELVKKTENPKEVYEELLNNYKIKSFDGLTVDRYGEVLTDLKRYLGE